MTRYENKIEGGTIAIKAIVLKTNNPSVVDTTKKTSEKWAMSSISRMMSRTPVTRKHAHRLIPKPIACAEDDSKTTKNALPGGRKETWHSLVGPSLRKVSPGAG